MFLAICILGCDFLLYVLYQWTYGEKRSGLSRRWRAPKTIVGQQNVQPFLVASPKRVTERKQNFQVGSARAAKRGTGDNFSCGEKQAYRRIAASFAAARR